MGNNYSSKVKFPRLDATIRNRPENAEHDRFANVQITDVVNKFIELKERIMHLRHLTMPFSNEEEGGISSLQMAKGRGQDFDMKRIAEEVEMLVTTCKQLDAIVFQQNMHIDFYIVDPSPSQATSKFVNAFRRKMLKDHIPVMLMNTTDQFKATDEKSRILLVCSITSRFESNLDILKDINPEYFQRIVLILLYCTEETNIPAESKICEAKKLYPNINKVVEMAFYDGIYQCKMNDEAWHVLHNIHMQ